MTAALRPSDLRAFFSFYLLFPLPRPKSYRLVSLHGPISPCGPLPVFFMMALFEEILPSHNRQDNVIPSVKDV